jgi:hypothetical protein
MKKFLETYNWPDICLLINKQPCSFILGMGGADFAE